MTGSLTYTPDRMNAEDTRRSSTRPPAPRRRQPAVGVCGRRSGYATGQQGRLVAGTGWLESSIRSASPAHQRYTLAVMNALGDQAATTTAWRPPRGSANYCWRPELRGLPHGSREYTEHVDQRRIAHAHVVSHLHRAASKRYRNPKPQLTRRARTRNGKRKVHHLKSAPAPRPTPRRLPRSTLAQIGGGLLLASDQTAAARVGECSRSAWCQKP